LKGSSEVARDRKDNEILLNDGKKGGSSRVFWEGGGGGTLIGSRLRGKITAIQNQLLALMGARDRLTRGGPPETSRSA